LYLSNDIISSSLQVFILFCLYSYAVHLALPPFPTRRSSDLSVNEAPFLNLANTPPPILKLSARKASSLTTCLSFSSIHITPAVLDRKSTRLNSSHVKISYAVFCLKKKKT